jgi:hypothetical protein
MSRLMSVLLVMAGMSLVAPAAHATPSVTISTSRTTLSHGDTVTFSGRAVGARPGSVVKLQRRVDGSWRTVDAKKVGSTRSYRFRTTPPRGYQRYRVRKPRQFGQPAAVSSTVKLTVRWSPTVYIGDVTHDVDVSTGKVATTVYGTSRGLPRGTILRRELAAPNGGWTANGSVSVTADGAWSDTFPSSHGWQVRYTAAAAGPRRAASTTTFTVDGNWIPTISVSAELDSLTDEVTVFGSTTGLAADVAVQRERLYPGSSWQPEGEPVPVEPDGSFNDAFSADMRFSYRYTVAADGPRQASMSAPFTVTDAPSARVNVNSTTNLEFPAYASIRSLVVHLDEGQSFTYSGPYNYTESIVDPTGAVLPGFGPGDQPVTAVAPVTGDYTVRIEADQREGNVRTIAVTLSAPLVIETALDAPSQDVSGALPAQLVDLVFEAEGGTVISEYAAPGPLTGRPCCAVSLFDPTGETVPTWGFLERDGRNWRLPAISGTYTLRLRPSGDDVVQRTNQAVLRAHQVPLTVDGGPARASFDRPGRAAVVSMQVPAGLRLSVSNTAATWSITEERFAPAENAELDPTVEGTYEWLVTADTALEVDYYAATHVEYDAAVGSTVAFDLGPAPRREAILTIPVTQGELFSLETLDVDGQQCDDGLGIDSDPAMVDWHIYDPLDRHPLVIKTAQAGDLPIRVAPCVSTGVFRLVPTTIEPSEVTGTGSTPGGYPTTTTRVVLEVTRPGQVAIVVWDAGSAASNRIDHSAVGTTFPRGTLVSLTGSAAGSNYSEGYVGVAPEHLSGSAWDVNGVRYMYLYAGPTATGSVEIELRRMDLCCGFDPPPAE